MRNIFLLFYIIVYVFFQCDVSENEAALNDKEENVVQVSSVETVSFEKNENEMSEEKLSTIHESPDSSSDSVPIKVNEDEEKYIFPADFIEQESDALKNVNELPEVISKTLLLNGKTF